ncbi:MAG: hypothetical protein ACOYMS_07620 [Terrimicrobiaceae bacterium]
MKIPVLRLLALGLVSACLAGVGCEMHPPSETIAGYAEKETTKQTIEKQESMIPEGANTNAPAFFPDRR